MLKLSMCFQKKMNEQVILRTIVYSLLCFFGEKRYLKKSVNYFFLVERTKYFIFVTYISANLFKK